MGVRWATGMRWIYFHARRLGLRDVGGDGGGGGVGGTDSSSYAAMYTKERPCLCKYAKKTRTLTLTLLSGCKRKWKKVWCHIHHMLGAKEEKGGRQREH